MEITLLLDFPHYFYMSILMAGCKKYTEKPREQAIRLQSIYLAVHRYSM